MLTTVKVVALPATLAVLGATLAGVVGFKSPWVAIGASIIAAGVGIAIANGIQSKSHSTAKSE